MLLMGPGGTGKTNIIWALHELMWWFHRGHRLQSVAFTCTAASLIQGEKIYLSMKIKVAAHVSGGQSTSNEITLSLSETQVEALHLAWKDTLFLLIYKVSMVSCKMFAARDQIWRFAKEQADVLFGGISVIASGDISQLPPVCVYLLWQPLVVVPKRVTSRELDRRYGLMAWKTFDTVVMLEEQMWMGKDPGSVLSFVFGLECALWRMWGCLTLKWSRLRIGRVSV